MTISRPSKVTEDYWVRTDGPEKADDKTYIGKWLIYVQPDNLDDAWRTVALATERGELGNGSKSATMKGNPNARGKAKVICVYTRDCRDIEDVRRVLTKLRELGFMGRIYYKEDLATYSGNYRPGQASLYESLGGSDVRQRRPVTEVPDDLKQLVEEFGIEALSMVRW